MPKGQILAYRRDRLGGRLRSMINALRLADWGGCDLRILWPVGHYAQELANPVEFFDAGFVETYFEMDPETIAALYQGAAHVSDFANYREMRAHLNAGKNIVVENSKGPIALPKESKKKAYLAFIETSKRILPSADVSTALAQFDKLVGKKSATALHVRRGDIIQQGRWSRTYWPTKYVPDEYYDVMIEASPDAVYLLFSDTPDSLERFEQVHGIRSAIDVLGLEALTPSQRDFAELLAIARCDRVIAASDSAFSSAATLLGGARKVSLPDDMPENLRIEAEQRLISRVETGEQAFLNQYDFGQGAHRIVDVLNARGEQDRAGNIVKAAAQKGLEVPHLTRQYLKTAVAKRDDLTALTIVAGEQHVRIFRRWHVHNPNLLKHHLRRQVIAGFSYAGLGRHDLAAKTVSNLALCQTKISPLDILSVALRDQLTSGDNAIPPATMTPFADGQAHPRGLPSLYESVPTWSERFLKDAAAWNWQASFDLDWRSIGVNDRPGPREPILAHIYAMAQNSDAPMERSLAAMAALRLGNVARAKRLMAQAEQLDAPARDLDKAVMLLRRAQIAEHVGNDDRALSVLQDAVATSDHPAVLAYYTAYLARHKKRGLARSLLAACDDPPFYLAWQRYELLAREKDSTWDREALGQECLDPWMIEVPDAEIVPIPTRVA